MKGNDRGITSIYAASIRHRLDGGIEGRDGGRSLLAVADNAATAIATTTATVT